jgi:hypothetical protein
MTPLDHATVFEYYPERRWVQLTFKDDWDTPRDWDERDMAELAHYVVMDASQDELREFVWNELGEDVRRVYAHHPGDEGYEILPGWLYLDYGITLVPTVAADQPLPIGGLRRDQIRRYVREHHRHVPSAPPTYLWGYAVYNGPPMHDPAHSGAGMDLTKQPGTNYPYNLIGVAMIGVTNATDARRAKEGKGPKIATVTRIALDHGLPRELTYQAASMIYDAAAQEAHRRGYDFLETYTLFSESGASLRYSKWRPPGVSYKNRSWREVGIARARKSGRRGEARGSDEKKWRWWKRLTNTWPWPKRPQRPKEQRELFNPGGRDEMMRELERRWAAGDLEAADQLRVELDRIGDWRGGVLHVEAYTRGMTGVIDAARAYHTDTHGVPDELIEHNDPDFPFRAPHHSAYSSIKLVLGEVDLAEGGTLMLHEAQWMPNRTWGAIHARMGEQDDAPLLFVSVSERRYLERLPLWVRLLHPYTPPPPDLFAGAGGANLSLNPPDVELQGPAPDSRRAPRRPAQLAGIGVLGFQDPEFRNPTRIAVDVEGQGLSYSIALGQPAINSVLSTLGIPAVDPVIEEAAGVELRDNLTGETRSGVVTATAMVGSSFSFAISLPPRMKAGRPKRRDSLELRLIFHGWGTERLLKLVQGERLAPWRMPPPGEQIPFRFNPDEADRQLGRAAAVGDDEAAAKLYVSMFRSPRPDDREWSRKVSQLAEQAGHLIDEGHAGFKRWREALRGFGEALSPPSDQEHLPDREVYHDYSGRWSGEEIGSWLGSHAGGVGERAMWAYMGGWSNAHRSVFSSPGLNAIVTTVEGDLSIALYRSGLDWQDGHTAAARFYAEGENPPPGDRSLRDLERRAASGDPEDIAAWHRARARSGEAVPAYMGEPVMHRLLPRHPELVDRRWAAILDSVEAYAWGLVENSHEDNYTRYQAEALTDEQSLAYQLDIMFGQADWTAEYIQDDVNDQLSVPTEVTVMDVRQAVNTIMPIDQRKRLMAEAWAAPNVRAAASALWESETLAEEDWLGKAYPGDEGARRFMASHGGPVELRHLWPNQLDDDDESLPWPGE